MFAERFRGEGENSPADLFVYLPGLWYEMSLEESLRELEDHLDMTASDEVDEIGRTVALLQD